MHERVETVRRVGGRRIHRFQVVRERHDDDGPRDWVVVAFGVGTVTLATPGFEWTRSVPTAAFEAGEYDPLVAGGVPVWGY